MIRKRLFQVLRSGLLLLCIGILYSIFLQWTGIGLICPVYFLTGLKCPGCGVSHMCIALMQFDFVTAFQQQQYSVSYSLPADIKTGRWQMRPVQNYILWFCIAVFILYGIGRNLTSLPIK